jgi:tetratricopeptide (TPR) repeat protein
MPSNREAARPRAAAPVALASLLVVVVLLLALVGRPLATDDLWWHLKLGEAYAQDGPWLPEDPLYHTTQNQPTVPHEWLFQVAVHGIERWTGLHGLRVAHVLLVVAILAWAFRIFRRAGGALAPAALPTIVFAELSWYRLFQFRPDLTTLVALLAFYVLLLEPGPAARPPSWKRVGVALGVLVLWANTHSLFAIGLALLFAALLGIALHTGLMRGLVRPRQEADGQALLARRLGGALLLGLIVTLANPRGFEQHLTFFVESASGDIWHLQDDFLPWNPFRPAAGNRALVPLCWLLADALLLAFALAAGAGFVRVLRERSAEALRDLDCVHLGLGAASIVAMLTAVRFHWMALFPLLYVLRAARRRTQGHARLAHGLAWGAAGLSLVLALALPGGLRLASYAQEVAVERDGYWRSPYLDQRYGGAGMRFLRDAGLQGRLFHPFNLGGFLGYWLAPDLRIFIDGRMDHYPGEVLDDYLKLRNASQRGAPRLLQDLLDKWEIDVFFGTSFPEARYADRHSIAHLRRLPGWVLVFASEQHSVYLRKTSRNQRNFERVKAYYVQRRLHFSVNGGLDVSQTIRRRPGWSKRQGLIPEHFKALQERSESPDPDVRLTALQQLGWLYWQIGAFEDGVAVERKLLALRPEAKEPRRRLADGLLLLGRPAEALEVARELQQEDPGYADIALIAAFAENRLNRSADP